jgi:hypothetical protein
MATANEILAHNLIISQKLLQRYTSDLAASDYLHRPTPKANCAAWLIGHLVLTERRALELLNVTDPPPVPTDFARRFSREEGCPQANEFGDVMALMPLFDEHRTRLIDAVRRAGPELLDKPVDKPHPMFNTVGQFTSFASHHVMLHAGQITIIRRSLGRPPLV